MAMLTERSADGRPNLPETHYVDNRIYTDEGIFQEERERIFKRVWNLACHESELPNPGDFRTTSVAGFPILIVRGQDGIIRAFYNVCRHRQAQVEREVRGNRKAFQCFYHLWTYDTEGRLIGVTRPEGYEAVGLRKEEFGLLPVRVDTVAGFLFICLSHETEPLRDYLGELLPYIEGPLGTEELEVFHYHQAVIKTNWKLWLDNDMELYHGYLHYFNRRTGYGPESVSAMWNLYQNGHTMNRRGINYPAGKREERTGDLFPTMGPSQTHLISLFPDIMLNLRTTVLRVDRMVPLSSGETLVEWRGVGLKGDTEEVRARRLQHHNLLWGPAGRNLPEDIMAVESQWQMMKHDVVRHSIFAREEGLRSMDDGNIRHFYQEWSRLMDRKASDPFP